jgi:hypothetical protein
LCADGTYDFDVVAAVQAYVAPSDAISVSVGADGRRGRPVSHGDALATASAAVKATGLTSSDVVTVTAPLGTHFGFAAGAMAANAVHAKTGAWERESGVRAGGGRQHAPGGRGGGCCARPLHRL